MAPPPGRDSGSEDLISNLPSELLSAVISRLGTAEAARTAVLSTRWRDVWRGTLLRLDDLELPAAPGPSIARAAAARADAVALALASHPGPVDRFRLSRTTLRARVPTAEAWFEDLAAGDHRAREVSLLCPPEWCHGALADPLLASPTLETLALGECRISDTGAAAASTSRLTELSLSRTHISEAALQSLLSGCPALRSLMLRHIQGPRRVHISSCRGLVLLGVWQYKLLEELTVEDAPRLERLLGDAHLGTAVTIVGAPKLTTLGYLVVGYRDIFHGIDNPPVQKKVAKGLRAPFNSVKILAISVTFSSEKDVESVMNLLKCFPFLEALHIQGNKRWEGEIHTIDSNYYQKLYPIGCIVNHLKSVRLEIEVENRRSKVENQNMLEFVCFLLANAQVLQIMKIQSSMSDNPAWITEKQTACSLGLSARISQIFSSQNTIESARISQNPLTNQPSEQTENLLSQCHRASAEAKVVFEGLKVVHRKGCSIEAVNALADPFDSDIDIMGY